MVATPTNPSLFKFSTIKIRSRGGTHKAIKNPKILKFSNPYQNLDLSSSNSYLNGTLLGVLKVYQFGPILALKFDILTIIGLLVIFTSKNKIFAPKR